jgi:hypothetical protein
MAFTVRPVKPSVGLTDPFPALPLVVADLDSIVRSSFAITNYQLHKLDADYETSLWNNYTHSRLTTYVAAANLP